MPKPSVRNLQAIRLQNPKLGELIDDLISSVGSVSDGAVVSPHGKPLAAPPPITGMTVTGAGGVHHISIQDGSAPIQKGIEYHLEVSQTPDFKNPVGISLGPHRQYRGNFGSGPTYFQAYSAYPGSPPSKAFRHPKPVDAGGAAGPDYHPVYTGSGTSSCNNPSSGQGAGVSSTRLGPDGRKPSL